MNQIPDTAGRSALLWIGTVAAALAIALPAGAAVLSGIDNSTSFRTDNQGMLATHEAAERLAATIHIAGLLATIVLIAVVAVRVRAAYPRLGTAAALIFLMAGTVFVLLRLVAPVGFAALLLLDTGSPAYEVPSRILESVTMIAEPVALLFAALAAFGIAIGGLAERAGAGLGHVLIGAALLLLGVLGTALDRDPMDRWADLTMTRPGGPLTTAGLLLVALWAVWLARNPKPGEIPRG